MVTQRLLIVLLLPTVLLLTSCFLRRDVVQYARATKLPEECAGFMRLVDGNVTVAIIEQHDGEANVSTFDTGQKKPVSVLVNGKLTDVECSAYLVLHEQDVAQFVKNTQKLQVLLRDTEVRKRATELKLLNYTEPTSPEDP